MPIAQMIDAGEHERRARVALENGTLAVRMTWMIRVCDSSDSTNQPVWNSAALLATFALEDEVHREVGQSSRRSS